MCVETRSIRQIHPWVKADPWLHEGRTSQNENMAIDDVLKSPTDARSKASLLIADSRISSAERRDALWTLGKVLLEANEIVESCHVLLLAAQESGDDLETQALVRGTLATALAKSGDLPAAHAVLDMAETHLTGAALGRIVNQRGLLHCEAGDFAAAVHVLERACALLSAGNDVEAEARSLFNLATVASIQGRGAYAETKFREVRDLAERTGQRLLLAGIEGNLAFTIARRADFPDALRHFERARQMFAEIGEVGLSVAVLEFDYAAVLSELGLHAEATDAARRSLRSSNSGGNKTQGAQARMQLAISLLEMGDATTARREFDRARLEFKSAGSIGWELRCEYFLALATPATEAEINGSDLERIALRLAEQGWARESDVIALSAASMALESGDQPLAERLLMTLTRRRTATEDQSDASHPEVTKAIALRFLIAGRPGQARRALKIGLQALDNQLSLFGSRELQTGVASRSAKLGELAMQLAVASGRAAEVLTTAEQVRAVSFATTRARPIASLEFQEALTAWRGAQADLDAAFLSGASEVSIRAHKDSCSFREASLRNLARQRSAEPGRGNRALKASDLRQSLANRVLVEYVAVKGVVTAVVVTSTRCRLVSLGPIEAIAPAMEAQRSSLRRLSGRSNPPEIADSLLNDADRASHALEDYLITPLRLPVGANEIILVPTGALHGVIWPAIAPLEVRAITVAPSASLWLSRDSASIPKYESTVGLVALPGLERADQEVRTIAANYGSSRPALVSNDSSFAGVLELLSAHDVVHLAAHGRFRADNPWFSSIRASDGDVSVFDIEGLQRVPRLVIVAACEAGASRVMVGDELVGTTAALLGVGVNGVIAPEFPVMDVAAERVMVDLHRSLAEGKTSAEALSFARRSARSRATPLDVATAFVFQHFGASWSVTAG